MNSTVAAQKLSHADIRTIVIGVGVAMFLGALDQTIIAAALPAIAGELGGFSAISWVASIYLLTATAVTPLYGKYSDIKGRRAALTLGIAVFAIGSVACAVADKELVIVGESGLLAVMPGWRFKVGRLEITAVAGVGKMNFTRYFIFSAIGALLWAVGVTIAGYFLGLLAYHALAEPILAFYGKLDEFERLRQCTGEDTLMILLVTSGLAHLPPIKVVTILAGVAQVSFGFFVLSCVIARGARFFALAWAGLAFAEDAGSSR